MFDEKTAALGRSVIVSDTIVTILAYILAYYLRILYHSDYTSDFYSHLALLPLILALFTGLVSYQSAYKSPRSLNLLNHAWIIFRGGAISFAVLMSLFFIFKIQFVSRYVILIFCILEFIFLLSIRAFVQWYFKRSVKNGKNLLNILIIGTGDRAKELSEKLRRQTAWGIKVLGHLDPDRSRIGKKVLDAPVIGTVSDIDKCLKESVVDEVIIAISRTLLNDVERIYQACEEEGIKLRFMADVFNLQVSRMGLIQIGSIPLLTLEPVAQNEIMLLIKRCFDLSITLLFMPVILPLIAIIAIVVKFDSPGPVFFIQQRVGFRKNLFPMIKFRSMHIDAEERMKEIEHLNEAEGPIFKIANDPRVTRVGKFLRKTSLDEIPQLFNVIRGEMSLVGPRPMSIRDVDLFDKGIQRKRFSVKPGLTCIWQISGRSNLPFEKWLELDLKYIESWTLWLDITILFRTLPAVFFSKGAV
jgi:exopolysaccharide biosynthesis polyprenyl glycosylphosphotransferase